MDDEDILIRLIAQDETKQAMASANASVTKLTDSEKKAAQATKEHSEQMQKLGNIAKGAAIAGIAAVTAAITDSIKETMDYTKSIRDLAQNLNITTEETSRIVQTADDFTVSQEAVTAALQMAVKKGMQPNIDTLAKMADLYNSISDPTERAAQLTEVFGRNWSALVPMLKEGGDAIRSTAASQNEALIVTKEQSDQTRELEKSMDDLNDKVEAVKLNIGRGLIPQINNLLSNQSDWNTIWNEHADGAQRIAAIDGILARDVWPWEVQQLEELKKQLQENIELQKTMAQTTEEKSVRSNMEHVKTIKSWSVEMAKVNEINESAATKIEILNDYIDQLKEDGFKEGSVQILEAREAIARAAETTGDYSWKISQLQDKIQSLINDGFSPESEQVKKVVREIEHLKSLKMSLIPVTQDFIMYNKQEIEGMKAYYAASREANTGNIEYKIATDALIISTKELTKETLFKIATEGMDADAALTVARSMGMIDEKTATNIEKARALKKQYDEGVLSLSEYVHQLGLLGQAIDLLPDMKLITIEMNYQTTGHAGQVSGEVGDVPTPSSPKPKTKPKTKSKTPGHEAPGAAVGADYIVPPGYNENWYQPVSSGERVIVLPQNQASYAPVINVYATPGMDVNALANAVSRQMTQKLRSMGAR